MVICCCKFEALVLVLAVSTRSVDSTRVALTVTSPAKVLKDQRQIRNSTESSSDTINKCKCCNFCAVCADNTTVWYGRQRNWWKVGVHGAVSAVVGGVAASGVGALTAAGWAAAEISALVVPTAWGSRIVAGRTLVGTTGLFCERMTVTKFKNNSKPALHLVQSDKKLGRDRMNKLKPYGKNGSIRMDTYPDSKSGNLYGDADKRLYERGCKPLKAAGLAGSYAQLVAMGQHGCRSKMVQAAGICSQHSQLCGPDKVIGFVETQNHNDCKKYAEGVRAQPVVCPVR